MSEGCIIKVRGLPWSVTHDELITFFEGCQIEGGESGIHFTYVRDGRPSGEAYLEMCTEEDVEQALQKDQQNLGKRYIEVFRSSRSEMDWVVKRSGNEAPKNQSNDAVIRLRGLPYGCSKEEIAHFFSGLEIVPNGITLLSDGMGRSSGDGFVQFASQEIADKAMTRNKEKIGHRYIELFTSNLGQLRSGQIPRGGGRGGAGMGGPMGLSARPGPYDRMDRYGGMGGAGPMGGGYRGRGGRGNIKGGFYEDYDEFPSYSGPVGGSLRRGGLSALAAGGSGGYGYGPRGGGGDDVVTPYDSATGHYVHMRGLPFAAIEQDIIDFFRPLNPVNVIIHQNADGRASGRADVDFATHGEAKEAMSRNKNTMRHRYIELFLRSTPDNPFGQRGGGMGQQYGSGYGSGNSYGGGGYSAGFGDYGNNDF